VLLSAVQDHFFLFQHITCNREIECTRQTLVNINMQTRSAMQMYHNNHNNIVI